MKRTYHTEKTPKPAPLRVRSVPHDSVAHTGKIVMIALLLLVSAAVVYGWRHDCSHTAGLYISCPR